MNKYFIYLIVSIRFCVVFKMAYRYDDDNDFHPGDEEDRRRWEQDNMNFYLRLGNPHTIGDAGRVVNGELEYNIDDRSHERIANEAYHEFNSVEDVYIPEMLPEENAELNNVLADKMRTIPQVHIDLGFVDPLRPALGQKIPGVPIPRPLTTEIALINGNDLVFSNFLRTQCAYLRQSYISERGFGNSLLENHTDFLPDAVTDANIVGEADLLGRLVGTIVYRYMVIMMNNAQIRGSNIQFKVQVGFKCLFKKPKKSFDADGAPFYDGTFEYLTFTKESMLMEDGVALRFREPLVAFRCAYNTTIETINNCLDARNVPNMDSAWRFNVLREAIIRLFRFESIIPGGKYVPIPKIIASKKACINPKVDSGCFWWCVRLALILNNQEKIDYTKPEDMIKKEQHEVKKQHTEYQKSFNIKKAFAFLGLEEPIHGDLPENVPLDQKLFSTFCKLNPNLFLSVFIENEDSNIPIKLYFEENVGINRIPIKLLFLKSEDDDCGHFVVIKNFNRFLTNIDKCHGHKKVYCDICKNYSLAGYKPCKHIRMREQFEAEDVFCCEKCMGTFPSADELSKHNHMCLIIDKNYRVVELPDEREYLEFNMSKKSNNLTQIPTFMVADFESVLVPVHEDNNGQRTQITANHLPCGYGIKVVSVYPPLESYHTYWGTSPEDTMEHFCNDIIEISTKVYHYYCKNEPMWMTLEQERTWKKADRCYICKRFFHMNEVKYRDHDHVTGAFLGTACNACNFKRVLKNTELPLIFHNAKGYDLHHIIKEITKEKYKCTFHGIAQNSEKIMSFTIKKPWVIDFGEAGTRERSMCDIKIVDSLLFLLKSLEKLIDILKKRSHKLDESFPIYFKTMREMKFTDEQIEVLLQKISTLTFG